MLQVFGGGIFRCVCVLLKCSALQGIESGVHIARLLSSAEVWFWMILSGRDVKELTR